MSRPPIHRGPNVLSPHRPILTSRTPPAPAAVRPGRPPPATPPRRTPSRAAGSAPEIFPAVLVLHVAIEPRRRRPPHAPRRMLHAVLQGRPVPLHHIAPIMLRYEFFFRPRRGENRRDRRTPPEGRSGGRRSSSRTPPGPASPSMRRAAGPVSAWDEPRSSRCRSSGRRPRRRFSGRFPSRRRRRAAIPRSPGGGRRPAD